MTKNDDDTVAPAEPTEPVESGHETSPAVAGADQVQAKVDEETDKGYAGHKVDPTPNENYTVGGVIAGLPTPETTKTEEATDA